MNKEEPEIIKDIKLTEQEKLFYIDLFIKNCNETFNKIENDGCLPISVYKSDIQAIQGLLALYNKEKEKYKRLSIEAQATAFDDQNKDTEGLLRVLLKQGEITLDEKGYYQREDFDWEENLYKLGLMKKKEKGFYIPDDECLDEYTKQLENQLKEYNEIKETFRKYCVMDNDTLYDGCCKMQDKIDELKEKNKELEELIKIYKEDLTKIDKALNLEPGTAAPYRSDIIEGIKNCTVQFKKIIDNSISKDKIKEKIKELNKEYEEYKNGQEWEIQDDIQAQISILEELLEERN